jgi:hypothetical protein
MPLNKVKELRNKLGLKLFNKTYFGKDSQDEVSDAAIEGPKKFKVSFSYYNQSRRGLFWHIQYGMERSFK